MAAISVRPELLQELAARLTQLAGEFQDMDGRLAGNLHGLDWDVRHRAEVEHLAAEGRRESAALVDDALRLSRFLQMKAEAFMEADRQGVAKLQAAAGPGAQTAGAASPSSSGTVPTSKLDPAQYGFSVDNQAFLAATDNDQRFKLLLPAFKAMEARFHIPWQIQAAQWALESGWGAKRPHDIETHQDSYNMFGVKGDGPAGTTNAWTTEEVAGKREDVVAGFRSYNNVGESVVDHALLLTDPKYAEAMKCGSNLRAWCEQLKACGYATASDYPDLLWNIITTSKGWVK